MSIIQQLEDLKEWSQDSTRYERRLAFRGSMGTQAGTIPPEWDDLSDREIEYYRTGPWSTREDYRKGQLVQPGPGRQGYAESKASTKTFSKETLQMKNAVSEYNELITDAVKKKDLSEISDFHNWYKKKTGKTFSANTYDFHVGASDFPQRKLLREVRIGLASDLIDEANAMNKHISKQKIIDKLGLKRVPGSAGGQEELVEIFNRYLPTEKKIQNYFDDMFMDFDKPADDVLSPKIRITEEFGVDRKIVDRSLNNYKNFKDMKPMMTRLSRAAFMKKVKGKNWTIGDVNRAVQSGTFFKRTRAIEDQLMDLAARHFSQGGDLIQFYKDGERLTNLGDLTSWDGVSFKSRPNNKVAFGKKVYGLGGDIANKNYVDLQLGGRKDPLFEEYFKQVDELDKLRYKEVQYPKGHPKAGKWTTFDQLMKETYNRASGYSYKRFPYELDHFGSIKNNPFGNIQILPRRINQAAGTINFWVPEADKAKYLERVKYKQTNLEDLVKNELKFAEDTLVFDKQGNWIGKKTVPLHKEAKEFFTKTGQQVPYSPRKYSAAAVAEELFNHPLARKAGSLARKIGVEFEAAFVALDFINNLGKGIEPGESLQRAFQTASLDIYKGGERKTIENILKAAEEAGFDPKVLRSLIQVNKSQNKINDFNKKINNNLGAIEDLKEKDVSNPSIQRQIKSFEDLNKRMESNLNKEIEIGTNLFNTYATNAKRSKGSLIFTDDDINRSFIELQTAAINKLKEERIKSAKTKSTQVDVEAGPVGDVIQNALAGVYTYPKYAFDVVNPLSPLPKWGGWKTEGMKEKERIIDMQKRGAPGELYRYNIARGFDIDQPLTGQAYETMIEEQPYLGLEKREDRAGGGIAGIRRPWAIPPESGPMPQGGGLSSQFNRVKKLTG